MALLERVQKCGGRLQWQEWLDVDHINGIYSCGTFGIHAFPAPQHRFLEKVLSLKKTDPTPKAGITRIHVGYKLHWKYIQCTNTFFQSVHSLQKWCNDFICTSAALLASNDCPKYSGQMYKLQHDFAQPRIVKSNVVNKIRS